MSLPTLSLPGAPPAPHYFSPEHLQFRAALRNWVAHEISPHANDWDEAESFPQALYKKAAEFGLLGLGYPEALGGTPTDLFFRLIASEKLARPGAGGVASSLMSHSIGLPPILCYGSPATQRCGWRGSRWPRCGPASACSFALTPPCKSWAAWASCAAPAASASTARSR